MLADTVSEYVAAYDNLMQEDGMSIEGGGNGFEDTHHVYSGRGCQL